jgi:3-methyladenine DNA glycosylase AlkD
MNNGAAVDSVLESLRALATALTREGMARYGLPCGHALGVSVGDVTRLGKQLGRDHDLALALWKTGVYEARLLCAYIGEPERLTAAQMDRWCQDFDNWGVVDTLCFHLFDRTPLAWGRITAWAALEDEFGKRAAFALLACLGLHAKGASDEQFVQLLPLIEQGAIDERNFVKKGVSWALHGVGQRKSSALREASIGLARRLAASADPAPRWVGKDVLKKLKA